MGRSTRKHNLATEVPQRLYNNSASAHREAHTVAARRIMLLKMHMYLSTSRREPATNATYDTSITPSLRVCTAQLDIVIYIFLRLPARQAGKAGSKFLRKKPGAPPHSSILD